MLYPKNEDCIAIAGNKYTVASLVAKRMKELTAKMPGEFSSGNIKELTYAMSEIANGKIVPTVPVV